MRITNFEKEIIRALRKLGISVYEINVLSKHSFEYFLKKHEIKLRRKKIIKYYTVKVYADFWENEKHFLGDTSVKIDESMDFREIEEKLCFAYSQAKLIRNEYYEILNKKRWHVYKNSKMPTSHNREKLISKILGIDKTGDIFNAIELCFIDYEMRYINSNEIVKTFHSWRVNGEIVTQSCLEKDVTISNVIDYNAATIGNIENDINKQILMTQNRSRAKNNNKCGKYDVIISGEDVKKIFQYYISKCDSRFIYMGYSDVEVGQKVGPDNLNISIFPVDKLSSDGVVPHSTCIIKNGVLRKIHGSVRYSYYLGHQPTGVMLGVKVRPSENTEIFEGTYFQILKVSDFQVDTISSNFCAEIRLAYFVKDGKKSIVTGGSISGELQECVKEFNTSSNLIKNIGYSGPDSVRLKSVSVSAKL